MVFVPKDLKSGPQGRMLGPALSLGMHLAAGVMVFTALGYWIDQKRGGGDLWTLCGIFLGLLYGGYEVWKVVRALQSEDTQQDHEADE